MSLALSHVDLEPFWIRVDKFHSGHRLEDLFLLLVFTPFFFVVLKIPITTLLFMVSLLKLYLSKTWTKVNLRPELSLPLCEEWPIFNALYSQVWTTRSLFINTFSELISHHAFYWPHHLQNRITRPPIFEGGNSSFCLSYLTGRETCFPFSNLYSGPLCSTKPFSKDFFFHEGFWVFFKEII